MRIPLLPFALLLLAACLQVVAAPAAGPLRVHPDNPRYFTDGARGPDGALRAVYLTGAHTWNNLVDMGRSDPPEKFDFDAYLDTLERHGHNFIRLWAWDSTVWDTRANGRLGKDFVHHVAPLPWPRTGPGNAPDGKPKFDLTKFDPEYFERLRARVDSAGKRGIYVSVMLFEGWGLFHGNRGRAAPEGWAWKSHPFHPDNNVNGLTFDDREPRVHRMGNKPVNDLQAAYIRKVVDEVNRFDNVLFEVINEGGQKEWDWWVVNTVREHERTTPKQHPIGITGHGAERLDSMLASPADWVSPGRADGYAEDPPAWDAKHRKVSLIDTDHVWGVGGNAGWVWKSFVRGHNPIFMDPYDGSVLGKPGDRQWEPVLAAMGHTRRLAGRMNLAAMAPHDKLASTGYCLASPAKEYVVYLPDGGSATVDLSAGKAQFDVEWINAIDGKAERGGTTEGGARREFKPPFAGAAVLHLTAAAAAAAPSLPAPAPPAAAQVLEHVVVFEDPLYYAAFPSIVRRPDGELLVAFRRAPDRRRFGEPVSHVDANSYLVLVRSKDSGKTWTKEPQLIHAHPFGGSQDPCMVQLRDGTIVCTSYAWAPLKPATFGKLPKPAAREQDFCFLGGYLVRSADGGRTWENVITPPPCKGEAQHDLFGKPVPAYNRGAMCEGRDGKLYWAVASNDAGGSRRTAAHLLVSADKGQTWEYFAVVARDGKVGFNETSLYQTPKGDLVAFLRTENFGDQTAIARSTDGGRTFKWQGAGFKGHPHHAVRLPDERVLLVYGYRHAPYGVRARVLDAECTDAATSPEVVLRDDGGNGDLGYPWATALPDGQALVVYYFNRADGTRHIAATVLKVN